MKTKSELVNEQSENSDLGKKFQNFTYPVDAGNWDVISSRIPAGSEGGFLKKKFAAYKVEPSRSVWRKIAAVVNPQSGKRIGGWWWYGAAAAVLLLGYLTFVNYDSFENSRYVARIQSKSEVKSSESTISESTNNSEESLTTAKSDGTSRSASAKANTPIFSTERISSASEIDTPMAENSFAEKAASTPPDKLITRQQSEMTNSKGKLAEAFGSEKPEKHDAWWVSKIPRISSVIPESGEVAKQVGELIIPEPGNAGITVKNQKESRFYDGTEPVSSNTFTVLAGSKRAFAGSSAPDNSAIESMDISFSGGSSLSNEVGYISASPVNYSTPIYYGVNGEIMFWKRFSVGLGLGYLSMKSNVNYYYPSQERVVEEIENRYLSVPLYVKFNVINKPRFTAYTSLGNAIDFRVWQKITADTYINDQLRESNSTTSRPKGNQTNIYAGLGMTFKFTNNLGVFAEGSAMRYYHSSTVNFYSQKNVWPGLKFGILVTF